MHQDESHQPDDRPTVPSLRPFDDAVGREPTWPVAGPRTLAPRGARAARSDLLPLALGLSLGVNVALLIGLVGTLLLARAGAFSPSSSSAAQSPATGSPTSTVLGTPTPTTPLSAGGWLQVAPSSVQLGCDGDQRTQFVVLTNTGSQDVQWQAVFATSTDQAAVEVGPNQGNLDAGASVVLQIRNRNSSTTQQGVIRFEPASSEGDAGSPPSLSYTAQTCG